jgi:hypothetical protein
MLPEDAAACARLRLDVRKSTARVGHFAPSATAVSRSYHQYAAHRLPLKSRRLFAGWTADAAGKRQPRSKAKALKGLPMKAVPLLDLYLKTISSVSRHWQSLLHHRAYRMNEAALFFQKAHRYGEACLL